MVSYDKSFKILILGEPSAEKSSFINWYCYNVFNPSERLTIGVDFHVKTIELNNDRIKLQLWDVGGEERFRFLLPTYCLGANAAFLLYDITRSSTLDNIQEWSSIMRQKGGDIPIIIIGSKLDLAENQRQIPTEHGVQLAEKNKFADFLEISAMNNVNVNKAFRVLAGLILQNMKQKINSL